MSEQRSISIEANTEEGPAASRPFVYRVSYVLVDGLQLLIVGLLLEFLLFSRLELSLVVRLLMVAFLLVGVAKSQGWLVLVAAQGCLFVSEPGRGLVGQEMASLVFCSLVILLIAYAYSFQATRQRISHGFAALAAELTGGLASRVSTVPIHHRLPAVLGSTAVVLVISVLIGGLLLRFMPLTVEARVTWLQRSLANGATFWPGATVMAFGLLIAVLLREMVWRQMTVAQSRLYLRSSFIQEHFWDLRMIVLRSLKMRKRDAASAEKKQRTLQGVPRRD